MHHLVVAMAAAWSTLESKVPSKPSSEKTVTLYRDTNGWCPFCHRVWLALEAQGIEYDEVLINLYDKPKYYTDMVPTGLVPALEFHDSEFDPSRPGSGELVYESLDILKKIDESFDGDPLEVVERLLSSAFAYVYRQENRTAFFDAIEEIDLLLSSQQFLTGDEASPHDFVLMPMLERYRYQLPFFVEGESLLRQRPGLRRWFENMDKQPFSRRVAGDEYSWTAVTSVFLRIFQNATNDDPRLLAADNAASRILENAASDSESLKDRDACLEAAQKIVKNREAIVKDACNPDPKSQTHLARCKQDSIDAADATLRIAVDALLSGESPSNSDSDASPAVARVVASRLCVPRDMGASAARALRHVLMRIASH